GFSDASAPAQAAGVDDDWNPAFMKALGEALERYGAAVYRTDDFENAPPGDLDDAVPPAAFVLPDGADADSAGSFPWIEGEELATGDAAKLPAEKAVFPPPERRFGPSITTGLGLGASTVQALLSGLYEVIERDATMLAWYSTFEPLELSVEDEGFDALARRAAGEGLSVTPLLVTQDVDVPVVAVAVHREGEWPRFAVGSDAD
ncbi:YcaO-like family protein, partial [Natronoarchaeum mannanilyticum]